MQEETKQEAIFTPTLEHYKSDLERYSKYREIVERYVDKPYKNLVVTDIELQYKCQNNFFLFCINILHEIEPGIDMYEPWIFKACSDIQTLHAERKEGLPDGVEFIKTLIVNATIRLGKTLIYTELHAAWAFGRSQHITKNDKVNGVSVLRGNYPYNIVIQTASQGTMKKMSSRLSQILNSNAFRKIMPYCSIDNDSVEKKFSKQNNSSIQFATTGSSLTGRGYNLIFSDDVLNPYTLHTKLHEAALEKTEVVHGRKAYNPDTKYVYVEQRLDYKDITNWAIKKFTVDGYPHYYRTVVPYIADKKLKYPIFTEYLPPVVKNKHGIKFKDILEAFGYLKDNEIIYQPGQMISPRFKWQDYLINRHSVHFRTHYQNYEITQPSGAIFTSEHIKLAKNHYLHKLSMEEIINTMEGIIIGVDVGVRHDKESGSSTPDRSAFGVVGYDAMTLREVCKVKGMPNPANNDGENDENSIRRYTVLECTGGIWSTQEVVDEMIRLYQIYGTKIERFQIEKNQGGENYIYMLYEEKFMQEMHRRGLPILHNIDDLIKGQFTSLPKRTRISGLAGLYMNGQVRHVVATNESNLKKTSIKNVSDVLDGPGQDKHIDMSSSLEYEMMNVDRESEISEDRLSELEEDAISFNPASSRGKSPDLVDAIQFAVNYIELSKPVMTQKKIDEMQESLQKFHNTSFW